MEELVRGELDIMAGETEGGVIEPQYGGAEVKGKEREGGCRCVPTAADISKHDSFGRWQRAKGGPKDETRWAVDGGVN